VDRDVHLTGSTLDVDAAHRGFHESLLQELANLEIRVHVRREVLGGCIPLRSPLARDAEANSNRIDFLTHNYSLSSLSWRLEACGLR
jgi:hypothetical protein